MPLKSLMTFLIRACVIISWPLRMPPSKRPMITSTIAISTKVKPASFEFLLLKADAAIGTSKRRSLGQSAETRTKTIGERLVGLAHQILIHPGFHVGRYVRSRKCGLIRVGLLLRADLAARRVAVVHLPVDRARHLLRQVREADDQAGEAQASRARAGLNADKAPGRVERLRPASGSRSQARDEPRDAQMLPEQVGFLRGRRSTRARHGGVVLTRHDPVAVTARGSLDSPARAGVSVVSGNGPVAVMVGGRS